MPVPSILQKYIDEESRASRKEYLFNLPAPWRNGLQSTLKDPRDLPVATLLVNIVLLLLPATYLVIKSDSHVVGAVILVLNYLTFLQRFLVALLHVSEHRSIFSKGKLQLMILLDSGPL